MDEQCVADIVGSIVSGEVLERSKETLDKIYQRGSAESDQMIAALNVYGSGRLSDEIEFAINEIESVCLCEGNDKLRNIIFKQRTTNAFPAVFSLILMAFHELFVKDKRSISDYPAAKRAITNLTERILTSRSATSSEERRKNIDTIKAIISPHFCQQDPEKLIYANHTSLDVDSYIRRSGIELANFELKQGIVSLGNDRKVNQDLVKRIVYTICALANNGPDRAGAIIVGVCDKAEDADRVAQLDGVSPRKVGSWSVVGVNREASVLGISVEAYHGLIRQAISASDLSEPLRTSVLSSIDFNAYYGLGVIIISVPPQKQPSFVGDDMYWRDGDNTKLVSSPKQVAAVAGRF